MEEIEDTPEGGYLMLLDYDIENEGTVTQWTWYTMEEELGDDVSGYIQDASICFSKKT